MTEIKEYPICDDRDTYGDGVRFTADKDGINAYCTFEGGYDYGGGDAPWEEIIKVMIKLEILKPDYTLKYKRV